LYVVRLRGRNRLRAWLAERGIATLIHYPIPVHRQEAYAEFAPEDGYLPVTDRVSSEIVSLPLHPGLEDEEVKSVIAAIQEFAASNTENRGWRIEDRG
jgi:dTDP-4-amino-4,6-dideoxygalactose transaminase